MYVLLLLDERKEGLVSQGWIYIEINDAQESGSQRGNPNSLYEFLNLL